MTLQSAAAAQAGSDEEVVTHPPGFEGFLPEKMPLFSGNRPAIVAGHHAQPPASTATTFPRAVGAPPPPPPPLPMDIRQQMPFMCTLPQLETAGRTVDGGHAAHCGDRCCPSALGGSGARRGSGGALQAT